MRSWAWLCAVLGGSSLRLAAGEDICPVPGVTAATKLLQRQHAGRPSRQINYGSPGCPCVGFDGLDRQPNASNTSKGQVGNKSELMSLGAHCDNWTRPCKEESCEAWCFVDPCQCNVSNRPSAATERLSWQGHRLHASMETCKTESAKMSPSTGTPTKPANGSMERPAFCDTFDQDQYGNEKCKCVGIEHLQGTVEIQVEGEMVEYPTDVGSHCGKWDDRPSGACGKEDRPSWCGKFWCYVDPCACAISEPPKVSTYFPKGSLGKKPLYYSYETCGSFDTFTFDSRSACVNQETEAKCLALGDDPDDPEIRKCAWGGPEIKCLGKELLHLCQVNDKTMEDWTWWSFSRGDVQRGHLGPAALVTGVIYGLVIFLFLMVLRGLA